MSGIAAGFIAGLLAAGTERGYEWTHNRLSELNREAEYSLDLDSVETEFQRVLEQRIREQVGDDFADPLSNVIESWDVFVHEIYGLESASQNLEELDSNEHIWLTVETEDEAVERIVDTWIQLAEFQTEETIPRQAVQDTVIDAYRESMRQFEENISSGPSEKLILKSVRDLRQRLDLLIKQTDTNVFKSRNEFERVTTLFKPQPEYVPLPGEREAIGPYSEQTRTTVEDSREELLRLIEEGVDVITVSGDGGSGKSRLLAAAGKELEGCSDRAVYYVNTPEQKPLPADQDTVLFVDDAGRQDMDYYINLAIEENRIESKRDFNVQVVAATRSVYEESVSQVVNRIGFLDTRTLWLQSTQDRQTLRLLKQYNLDQRTTTQITEQSDGNPLFAVLLAKIAAKKKTNQITLDNKYTDLIGEIILSENDLGEVAVIDSPQGVEGLLKWIALHQRYVESSDSDNITEQIHSLSSPIGRRQQLDSLADAGYLNRTGTNTGRESKYVHRYDVLSDYLRLEVIDDNQFYPYVQSDTIHRKATGIAQGLADLESSPLTKLYPDVQRIIESIVSDLSEDILVADIPLQEIVEAEGFLLRVAPSEVPIKTLRAKVLEHGDPKQIGDSVYQFVGVLFQKIGAPISIEEINEWLNFTGILYDNGAISSEEYGEILSHAIRNYGNVGETAAVDNVVEIIHYLPSSIAPEEFAVGLANAASIYSKARQFERLEDVLSKTFELKCNYEDADIHVPLSMGLMNAAAGYGAIEYFNEVISKLSEIESLYKDHPQTDVSKYYGMALANAIIDSGDNNRFDELSQHLKALRHLYDRQPQAPIRREFAIGLYNAVTSYARSGDFESADQLLSELDDLYASSHEDAVRNELADALVDVAGYAAPEQTEKATEAVSELKDLSQTDPGYHTRKTLARGYSNLIEMYRYNNRWCDLDDTLSDLRVLYSEHPETGVCNPLARSLMAAVARHTKTQNWDLVDHTLDELSELHANHRTDEVRAQLALGLLYATEGSLSVDRNDAIDEYITELLTIGKSDDDLSGLTQHKSFLPVMQEVVAQSLPHTPETAHTVINLISEVTEDRELINAQVKISQIIQNVFENDKIDSEIYIKFIKSLEP